jgi:hypothetical protein
MRSIRTKQQVYSSLNERNPWLTGLRQTPVWGTLALLLSIVGILFSAIVLAVSDGKTLEAWEDGWRFSPTVYLSIASTIVNICLEYAFLIGLDIAWWRTALASDTTIGTLHNVFRHGHSFFGALTAYRHPNLIAIACILVSITPINGPLLQRASQVRTRNTPLTRNFELSIAPQLPRDYSGWTTGRAGRLMYTTNFSSVVREYSNQVPASIHSPCENDCKSTVLGAGWSVDCQSSSIAYDMDTESAVPLDESNGSWVSKITEVFQSSVTWSAQSPSFLHAGAQMKTTTGCHGDLLIRNCSLVAATVEYPVRISGNTISLEPGSTIWGDTVVGPVANVTYQEATFSGSSGSTWGGVALALGNQYRSYMMVSYDPIADYSVFYEGSSAHTYIAQSQGFVDCSMTFSDPMDDILSSARELMFRAAINAGSVNSSFLQQVTGTETIPRNVYESQYLFLGLAVGLSIVSIIVVTVTFIGFWHIGRDISLNPIETAKAFNAPLLRSHNSNATASSLFHELGSRPARYGAIAVGNKITTEGNPEYAEDFTLPLQRHGGASEEIELQENTSRHARNGSQASIQLLPIQGGNDGDHWSQPVSLHGREPGLVEKQEPLVRLEISDPHLVRPPVEGATYAG